MEQSQSENTNDNDNDQKKDKSLKYLGFLKKFKSKKINTIMTAEKSQEKSLLTYLSSHIGRMAR